MGVGMSVCWRAALKLETGMVQIKYETFIEETEFDRLPDKNVSLIDNKLLAGSIHTENTNLLSVQHATINIANEVGQ